MVGTPSAWLGFAGGVLGGLVSATLGQILVVFRRRYQQREELRRILTEISELDQDDIEDAKDAAGRDGIGSKPEHGVHIWQLRSQLRDSLSKSYSFTSQETRELVEGVIDRYAFLSRHLDTKPILETSTAHNYLTSKAAEALESLENESRPRIMNWPNL